MIARHEPCTMKIAETRRSDPGMTLLEILVAFAVFVLLIGALVSLTNLSLNTWTDGEDRKDAYDRGQVVLGQISSDLRNLYTENEYQNSGNKKLMPAAFLGDTDSNGAGRLRFVRGGDADRIGVPPSKDLKQITPSMLYGDFWEVVYVMDSDGSRNTLWRGVRYFDRETSWSLFRTGKVDPTTGSYFRRYAVPLERGVLHLGFRYWTAGTKTWMEAGSRYFTCRTAAHRSLVQLDREGECPVCGKKLVQKRVSRRESPSLVWDSTRRELKSFRYYRKNKDLNNADFLYPEIIQITLVVESQTSEIRGARLAQALGKDDMVVRLTDTSGLRDPPDYVKIGSEWIAYSDLTFDEIKVSLRGARGTKKDGHKNGATVHYGETFVTEVRLPVHREGGIR